MPRHHEPIDDTDDSPHYSGPSKTQLKNAMLELQDLGEALLTLPEATLASLEMDDLLRTALRDLRRLTNHGARKRQLQFVGKLMRNEEVAPYRQALAEMQAGKVRDMNALKDVEHWRERLLTEEQALAALFKLRPAADTTQFRALVRNAKRERSLAIATAERTHAEPINGPFFRALFKVLRELLIAPPIQQES
jgi:ribosome-associated protein